MPRISKPPEERRQEILDTAMRLFTERGYEETSMADIAREMDVVQGLCYRYFDSKQKLFSAALEAYAEDCCRGYIRILDDVSISLADKIDALFDAVADEESLRYHDFFHEEGNREFHRQLGFELCDRLRPHMVAALTAAARKRGATVASPEVLVDFITHGQLNILASMGAPDPETMRLVRSYVCTLLDAQTKPLD